MKMHAFVLKRLGDVHGPLLSIALHIFHLIFSILSLVLSTHALFCALVLYSSESPIKPYYRKQVSKEKKVLESQLYSIFLQLPV